MTRRHIILAATGPDPFAALLGDWQGDGTFLGRPAKARYRFERILQGKFVRLAYQALDPAGKLLFEGIGHYKDTGEGTWHDSQGNLYSLTWKSVDAGVATAWNKVGASTYRRVDDGLEVTDQTNGKTFAQFRLHRA